MFLCVVDPTPLVPSEARSERMKNGTHPRVAVSAVMLCGECRIIGSLVLLSYRSLVLLRR